MNYCSDFADLLRERLLSSEEISPQSSAFSSCASTASSIRLVRSTLFNYLSLPTNYHLYRFAASDRMWLSSIDMINAPSKRNYARSLQAHRRFSSKVGSLYLTIAPSYFLYRILNSSFRMSEIAVRDGALVSGLYSSKNYCNFWRLMLVGPWWMRYLLTMS